MSMQTYSLSVQRAISAVRQTHHLGMVLAAGAIALLAFLLIGARSVYSSPNPTISIVSVQQGESVTIRTHNFPANQAFAIMMGKMGTQGVGGITVSNVASGDGSSMDLTVAIPDALKNERQVAIRLQTGHANPYFAYNWFYNAAAGTGGRPTTTPAPVVPVYTGIPSFVITAVEQNNQVTIETRNFPPNQAFNVTMGRFGTRGRSGINVGTIKSGASGAEKFTFAIPGELQGLNRVAVRAQSAHANPYFAYNWFYNSSTTNEPEGVQVPVGTGGQPEDSEQKTAVSAFVGTPTFKVCSVNRNNSVTIATSKLPANQDFAVTMGAMHSQGVGGVAAGSFNSGDGAAQRVTLTIPTQLHNLSRIAIRAQTNHAAPFFAYNWFYNSTASVC